VIRAVVIALLFAACDDGRRATVAPQDRAGPVSQELLLSLAQVRALHHQADAFLQIGEVDAAIVAVSRVLDVSFPAGAEEAEDTRIDARARLAKLHLGRGRPDEARRVIDEGFRAATRESFFLANLAQVSGEVHEAEARRQTDPEAGRRELRAALADYDKAVQIAERIQQRLLKEGR